MEFIEEWFLVYWKQPDHWIVLLKTYDLSLKVGWLWEGGVVDFWLSTKVKIFGFLDLRLDLDFGLDN